MNEGSARKVSNAIVTHPEYSQFKSWMILNAGSDRESFPTDYDAHIAHGIQLGVSRFLKKVEMLASEMQATPPQQEGNIQKLGKVVGRKVGTKTPEAQAPPPPVILNKDPDDFD